MMDRMSDSPACQIFFLPFESKDRLFVPFVCLPSYLSVLSVCLICCLVCLFDCLSNKLIFIQVYAKLKVSIIY